ncbi:alpha/beta fold hydrolase [Thermomonospora cellulosilytica]|uniref:Pimeloyl-ACP methyl ester carboxylesterase n=1 Tax=Thermomonospora cellulosilytica TaxID=1411118 RepID=A0A7W3MZH5_9ACTN|nr:alpha/beta fold hydrolase [Thermomonospora cellulosilytica]MBA9004734.1 pimeloyl-ACP methyl ester carboxylesterase [Thermomonospora cellulosilytica]
MERITARDGARIALHSTGTGPGIVVVHGGGVTIDVYRRLAAALAGRFTVHLYNRRGRADAPPRSRPYTVDQDVDDLAAVLEHTGARNVIGHSYGGFVALRAALRLPMDRLALYDAAICIDGGFPTAWLDAAREALRAGDTARALAITGAGINPQMPASRLPPAVQTAICRAFLRTRIGRTMGDLLPTTLEEADQARAYDGPAEQWAGITAEVLLACGVDGPPYYAGINEALARVLPRARTLQIPRSGHDAVNRARRRLVEPLAAFFAGAGVEEARPATE